MTHKMFSGVFAYCKIRRLPEVDDAVCMFDDCPIFEKCCPDEWQKLSEERNRERKSKCVS